MMLKIGILLPRSDMFPTLARDFLNGLKLVFRERGDNIPVPQFEIESIGNATGDSLLKTIERILIQDEVDLVISFCSYFTLKQLVDIFSSYQKPLIHVDLGGNILKKEHVSSYVLHHTLNLCQSSYVSGCYAANQLGKKAAVAASFYDGGYHLTESFVRGFIENGGNVVYNYVSPFDYKSESFDSMIDGLQKSNPDFVYLLFSYKEGEKIFEKLAYSALNGKVRFLASPLMTDESSKPSFENILNIFSVASWAIEANSESLADFKNNFEMAFHTIPTIINLIAYETGQIIDEVLKSNNEIPAKIGEYLRHREINSVRGKLTFSDYYESQISEFKIRKFLIKNQQVRNEVVGTADFFDQNSFYEKFKDLPYSGWQNPYIIT